MLVGKADEQETPEPVDLDVTRDQLAAALRSRARTVEAVRHA
jgi:hypothetical protein